MPSPTIGQRVSRGERTLLLERVAAAAPQAP
ncbi:hypothetical protein J2S42_006059 [Catenuloplanes indicus]|uniref:Uncharacterized protein n=1 Tax=Catenuloplanes indicus TaxID=137267 RepID=A0AAE4AZQ4_9ACTN|nr:hypothetical protein [Catenuloplanes indicus]